MTDHTNFPSLKAMAEGKVDGISKMTIFTVDPDVVEFEEGFNLREEGPELDAHLESLYQAMKAGAQVPPIDVSVQDGRVIARDGHCRTRTARRLKAEGVPYLLQARQFRGNEADCVFHMLGTANGKALTPLEQGRGFLRLMNYNLTVADIARRAGLNRTTIENGVILAQAPVEVQSLIVSGAISAQVALDMLKKYGGKAAEHLQRIVGKAKDAGVKKVTRKHVAGPRVTPKIAERFVSAATEIRDALNDFDGDLFTDMTTVSDDEYVYVPAKALKAMMAALDEVKTEEL